MSVGAINSTENKNHTLRNTLIGAGAGALGGAAIGQFTSPILKDGKYTDEFLLRASIDNSKNIKSANKKSIVKFAMKILNLGDDYKFEDVVKIFKSSDKKVLEELGVDKLPDLSSAPNQAKTQFIEEYIKPEVETLKDIVADSADTMDKLYDKTSKSFKTLAENSGLEDDMKAAKKVFGEMRHERVGKFGGIGLLVCGMGAWAYSKFTKPKAND